MSGAPADLQIRLLGALQVTRAGAELPLGSARQQAVFAALAMTPGRALSRQELVHAVWGDYPPPSATGNLYTYVSALRRVLEPDRDRWSAGSVLTSGGGMYCLHVAPENVDTWRFEMLREQSRTQRVAGNAEGELAALRSALDLWQWTEALAGIPGPYANDQRGRLDELYLVTAERHAELMFDLGREAEVVAGLCELIGRYPIRESLHAVAMRALARQGRRNEAAELYRQLRHRLIELAGTEPGPALRNLHAELAEAPAGPAAAQRATPDPAKPDAVVDPGVPSGHTGLLGRAAEVARLERAVAQVSRGRGGSIWIDGAAGIGKSALLAAGLREATTLGCQVGWATADELTQRVQLSVVLDCLAANDDPPDRPDPAGSLLATLRAAAGSSSQLTAVVSTVQALVHLRSADRPQVLVIDDLQWADDTSVLVWQILHRLTDTTPLLLVTACRPVPSGPELRQLRRATATARTEFVPLSPLDDAAAAELVRLWAGAGRCAEDAVKQIVSAAAGNPFYLRHITEAAISGGDENSTASAPTGAAAPTAGSALVTEVSRHLIPLTDETRQLLRTVAFIGPQCPVAELPAITGKPAAALVPAVEQALAAGLLAESDGVLTLCHPVVRMVLYDLTPTALRIMMHRDFAQRIAESGSDPARVAEQIIAGPVPVDDWVEQWLATNLATVSATAPQLAIATLQHATAAPALSPTVRERLTTDLARVVSRRARSAEGVPHGPKPTARDVLCAPRGVTAPRQRPAVTE